MSDLEAVLLLIAFAAVFLMARPRTWVPAEAPEPWWPERRPGLRWEEVRRQAYCAAMLDRIDGTHHINPHDPGTPRFVQWAIDYAEASELLAASTPATNPIPQPEPNP